MRGIWRVCFAAIVTQHVRDNYWLKAEGQQMRLMPWPGYAAPTYHHKVASWPIDGAKRTCAWATACSANMGSRSLPPTIVAL